MPNKNKVLEAVQDTLGEIQDLLQKSGYDMNKADDEQAPEAGEQAPEAGEQAPEMSAEQAPQEDAEQAPEAGEQAPEAEGADELASQAKELSDEELDHMLEVLLSEKESRHGGEQAPQEQAPEAGEQAPQEQAPEMAEKSMKSEFASLAKSMTDSIERLSKEVSELKTKPAAPKVTTRPAVSNKQQVLEKSAPAPKQKQRLSKSDTLTFLEGRMRQRDPAVNSRDIAEICNVRDDRELANIQDRLEVQGIQFPSK